MTKQHNQRTLPLHRDESLFDFTFFEREAYKDGYAFPSGIDEAGRGPLAGPVVASACILPDNYQLPGLNDSKKLTPLQRERFFSILTQDSSVHYGVGIVSHEVIDAINILEATKMAMCRAVQSLKLEPDFLLIDAVNLDNQSIPFKSIIKGDSRSQSIAAASVIAKVTRDQLMVEYDTRWPQYGFAKHKGYGTVAHRNAIRKHGPCPIHRYSFEPIKSLP